MYFFKKLKRLLRFCLQYPRTLRYEIQGIQRHPLATKNSVRHWARFIALKFQQLFSLGQLPVSMIGGLKIKKPVAVRQMQLTVPLGLHEPEEMIFLFKALKPHDLFVDVGANIGTFSVPISHLTRCRSVAIEAISSSFKFLKSNIERNGLSDLVTPMNVGVASQREVLSFTKDLNVSNKVSPTAASTSHLEQVQCYPLDELCQSPTALKIDVEGFESQVLKGATRTLNDPKLKILIIELNGHGEKYFGFDENILHDQILAAGFTPAHYDIKQNTVSVVSGHNMHGNTIYLRDINQMNALLKASTFSLDRYL